MTVIISSLPGFKTGSIRGKSFLVLETKQPLAREVMNLGRETYHPTLPAWSLMAFSLFVLTPTYKCSFQPSPMKSVFQKIDTITEYNILPNHKDVESTSIDTWTKQPLPTNFWDHRRMHWGDDKRQCWEICSDIVSIRNLREAVPMKCYQHGCLSIAWTWHQLTFCRVGEINEASNLEWKKKKNYRQLRMLTIGEIVFQVKDQTKCFFNTKPTNTML